MVTESKRQLLKLKLVRKGGAATLQQYKRIKWTSIQSFKSRKIVASDLQNQNVSFCE